MIDDNERNQIKARFKQVSILRIVIGLLIGICLLAGGLVFLLHFPAASLVLVMWSASLFFVYMIFRSFRRGVIVIRGSVYKRVISPFSFWFYIILFGAVSAITFTAGLHGFLHPKTLLR